MKSIKRSIVINKPVEEVFAFTINPGNTPKWVAPVVIEQTSEWPVKIGTMYRSQGRDSSWMELQVTAFEHNKTFTMQKHDGSYVSYSFSAPDAKTTQLDYIWAGDGDLDPVFLNQILTQLKTVMEAKA